MRPGTHCLSELVRDRSHVCAGRAVRPEPRFRALDFHQLQLKDFYWNWLHLDLNLLARQTVRRHALNLLGRDRGRPQQELAPEGFELALERFAVQQLMDERRRRRSLGVVRISGITKENAGVIDLVATHVKLRQARGPPD